MDINGGERVNQSSFSDCKKLRKVTFYDGLEQINSNAFYNCTALMSITIPASVESCSTTAFEGCTRLVEVIDKSQSKVASKVASCMHTSSDESIIDYVDDFAFLTVEDGTYLIGYVGTSTDITLPESYNGEAYKLYLYAFNGSNITSVVINGIVDIVDNAFNNCTSLTSVVIGDGVKSIGAGAFDNCGKLAKVVVGNGVVSIGENAFRYAYALSEIKLGSSVETIGNQAFYYCNKLGKILIPASVKFIGTRVFSSCSSLGSLKFEDASGFWRCQGESQIEEMDLTDPAVNVDYFYSDYSSYSWKKVP